MGIFCVFFFFFKQKTAYEITEGDWSSDVCSSDLTFPGRQIRPDKSRADAEGVARPRQGIREPTAKKSPASRMWSDRTVIRHRWARRVASGARVIYGEGTRQNDPVTSEEGVPVVGEGVHSKPNPAAENRVKRLFSKNTGVC